MVGKLSNILQIFGLLSVLLLFQPETAEAQCRLCADSPESATSVSASSDKKEKPLRLDVVANLDFSRLAMLNRGGGEVAIDPMSKQRRISGGIRDLGGLALHGEGRLEGEPGRLVRVQLPERIILNSPNGSTAELVKLDTDLPVQARLDSTGRLNFSFGGRLRVSGNASGQYRGRIAITAEYE